MTRNQISYWELQEQKRSNKANEFEKERDNRARLAETNRLNTGSLRRMEIQNATDIAKTVTGGIKDISSAFFGKGGVASIF